MTAQLGCLSETAIRIFGRIAFLAGTVAGFVTAQPVPRYGSPPFPYASIEVTYQNAADGVKLAGTLTLPNAAGALPGGSLGSR